MKLLKCLRTADERAEDFLLDEDGFPDDLKELVEEVSLDMFEEIVRSPLGNLLLPSTIERLREKKKRAEPDAEPDKDQLDVTVYLGPSDAHSAHGEMALSNTVQQREKAAQDKTAEQQRLFWERLQRATASALGSAWHIPSRFKAGRLRNIGMDDAFASMLESETGLEPEPVNRGSVQQLEAEAFVPSEDAGDTAEFRNEYSALKAAERAINDIHVRLLTRGEGPTEEVTVRLVAEAMRIIGCARELGADKGADEAEQKLSRILEKFGGTIS